MLIPSSILSSSSASNINVVLFMFSTSHCIPGRISASEDAIESRLASQVLKLTREISRSLTTPPPIKAADAAAFGSATNAKKARSLLTASSLAAVSLAASTAGEANEGSVVAGSSAFGRGSPVGKRVGAPWWALACNAGSTAFGPATALA
jgi:hypothetical protein